ncbi:MAG: OmpA family protein [Deltaproteobacteria bacterium]|jgi:outer membrane protein OmpA-like peptidoglycan-associated protein|nr:OmpA family protein [Deltaproteobacteria bacterium]MBW2534825.1 OmpA family protein [Deltaproteobacteria bacterium]
MCAICRFISAGCAVAALIAPRAAPAQVDGERFKPAVTHDGFVTTEGASVRPEQDRWEVGLYANYARDPMRLEDPITGAEQHELLVNRVGFDLLASLTVAGPFAIGLDIPFFVPQTGDPDPDVGGLGDIRLVPKLRLLDDRELFGLGIAAELRAPTHVGDYSGAARNVVFVPKLLMDNRFGSSGFRVGGNVGVMLREATELMNVTAASEFIWAAALSYRIGGWGGPVTLGTEFWGGVGLASTDVPEETPLEGLLYGQIHASEEWTVSFGPGVGVVAGYGVPVFRAFAGVRFTPTAHDRDQDRVADDEDECPGKAEDWDNDFDHDGCPEEEADHDYDGVRDVDDRCPDEKETINGIEDDDGCPDEGESGIILSEGKITTVRNIQFRVNSADIDPESLQVVNQVALLLKSHPEIKHCRVEGHTDATGTAWRNRWLSQARADAVRRYLISRGVSPRRVSSKGYGSSRPIARGTDEKARSKNRRVEFVLEQ